MNPLQGDRWHQLNGRCHSWTVITTSCCITLRLRQTTTYLGEDITRSCSPVIGDVSPTCWCLAGTWLTVTLLNAWLETPCQSPIPAPLTTFWGAIFPHESSARSVTLLCDCPIFNTTMSSTCLAYAPKYFEARRQFTNKMLLWGNKTACPKTNHSLGTPSQNCLSFQCQGQRCPLRSTQAVFEWKETERRDQGQDFQAGTKDQELSQLRSTSDQRNIPLCSNNAHSTPLQRWPPKILRLCSVALLVCWRLKQNEMCVLKSLYKLHCIEHK